MEFEEAYKTIVKRSVEKNTKEIPAILSCLDFEGLKCLEVGAWPEGRVALKLAGFAKYVTCMEREKDNVLKITATAEYLGLEKKVSVICYPGAFEFERFPFDDKSFDVVYCAWLPHKIATDSRFLDEMIRVSKNHVLILMPGIKGDEPKLVSILRQGEKERRIQYRDNIIKHFEERGYRTEIKYGILKLDFKDEEEIRGVFYCLAFKNEELGKKKKRVDKFLDKRVHDFKDGFYIVHAHPS